MLERKPNIASLPEELLGDLIGGPRAPLGAEMSPSGSGWVDFEGLDSDELISTRAWLASLRRIDVISEGPSPVKTFEIDGDRFTSLTGFYDEVGRQLMGNAPWGRNLDAFNDILRGNIGLLPERFRIIWRRAFVSKELMNGTGPGSFVDLLDIINDHQNVDLVLD